MHIELTMKNLGHFKIKGSHNLPLFFDNGNRQPQPLQIFSHRKAAKTTTDHDSMLGSKGHKRFFKNISILNVF